MRIALLIDSLVSGGAQRQMVNLAGMFHKSGHEVYFIVYHEISFYSELLHSYGVHEEIISSDTSLGRILKIRKRLRQLAPDFLISFLEVPNFIACLASIGKHKWRLITNELSAKESTFTSARSRAFNWFESLSDAIVCNSRNARDMWVSHYPRFKDKLRVIYNPVIINDFQHLSSPLNPGRITLVVMASYQYLKNPIGLVNALLLLSDDERNALKIEWYGRREVVSGDDRAFREADDLIRRNGLETNISLHDECKDIYPIIAASDVVGLFSTVEGLPNAICEGMMLGKPVVMTPMSDYSTLVNDDRGFLCEGFDAGAIAQQLRKLIASRRSLSDMGCRARSFAVDTFDPDVILGEWERLFRELR